ncbi:NTP transferase domain-containing protein [Pediococcus argentinicus]|uniref:MobA-like NTP transferase domain-containing protein n=1 Tax=Pediococcus argentinicus TaxID=480391 RepID=A0A0R2NE06_9LACO|nr:NTP transferase domain-containing protein [Pediococcus argentinicus]KRO24070.1 hypothetical protein IV88_GL000841 [Pediococcus argentinicus]NKZ22524.1 NTP transferase domain-containing protein [Pediococcus argentinicus]GEP19874.1 protein LicC [Pediococcus argentinicus]
MNAIIMAAGLGSRFKEMTKNTPKSLLPINGVPNLERTLTMLNEKGISDILIITGYLAEKFNYLVDKYPGVKIKVNPKYREYNSMYTFSFGLDSFGDSLVIDGDTVMNKNIFETFQQSTYVTKIRTNGDEEWYPVTNNEGKVIRMDTSSGQVPTMTGVSYWSQEDANVIKLLFDQYLTPDQLDNSKLYWDNIPTDNFDKLNVTTFEVSNDSMYEMDNQEQYYDVQTKVK